MTSESMYLTQDGFERLRTELEALKHGKRKEIAERIQEAKELGDLSENAEYTDAKNEQAFVEGRVIELEHLLKHATIIEQGRGTTGTVNVGSRIRIRNGQDKEMEFVIVGSTEADPQHGRISNESPLGRAFVGRQVGDRVAIHVPRGTMSYEILDVR
ncbi:MAG: transcription elongation factor GreA [Candidatus Kerfeldbacteria bacterium]|nr:transcription elongation factor GreA [Candidatus Kerfeldbacteria bacterium]